MRTIVLGGTRFIGRALVDELAGAGHELLVVHRGRSEPDGLPRAEHLHVARADLEGARERLAAFRPDAFVDTYAMTRADAEDALAALPAGLWLVVLSSIDVYRAFESMTAGAITDAVPLAEDAPLRERRYPYRGKEIPDIDDVDLDRYEKLDVEEAYLARGATVCRLPFVYGEHDHRRREEFVLRRVRAGRRRIPIGPGTWLGSRGYVRELARGIRLALESEAAAGDVLNLAEERTWPARVWAERILAAAGWDAELVTVPDSAIPPDMPETEGGSQHLLVSALKARELLGWVHSDPDPAVRASVAWHLANPPQGASDDFSADDAALMGAALR
jgi:UDP-glucose 4-epimerase